MLNATLLFPTYLPCTFNDLEGELITWIVKSNGQLTKLLCTELETIFLPLMDIYPNIKRILLLFTTIFVTTCTPKR